MAPSKIPVLRPRPSKKSVPPVVEFLPQPEADGRRNLTSASRVQRFLGVSRSTLMRYIADRKIDAIKMDGGWRFRWEDVDRFVQRRTQKAA